MIITIDGPAGTGKSSAARNLAARLEFDFLDTGAMYRSVALLGLEAGLEIGKTNELIQLAEKINIEFDGFQVFVNGVNVTRDIRTPEVTQAASAVAVIPEIRDHMVGKQREFAVGRSIVTEGRDQGTIVFPQAECKFFLTASPSVRVDRRMKELHAQGKVISRTELEKQQAERDQRDQNRDIAPLIPADDAEIIDTSEMTLEGVVEFLEQRVKARMSAGQ